MEAREVPFPASHVDAPVLPEHIGQFHRDTVDGGLDITIDITDNKYLGITCDFPPMRADDSRVPERDRGREPIFWITF